MRRAKLVTPVAMLHHQKYDETPLKLCVTYPSDLSSGSESQVSKVFVIEGSWSLLLEREIENCAEESELEKGSQGSSKTSKFMLLRGHVAPAVRCGVCSHCTEHLGDIGDSFGSHWIRPRPSSLDAVYDSLSPMSSVQIKLLKDYAIKMALGATSQASALHTRFTLPHRKP